MLLPEIKIPVSIDIFETQLEYFIAGYSDPLSNSFSFKRCDIGNSGHRYSVYVEKNDSEKPTQILVGEIDVIMINVNKVVLNSAAYSIEENRAGTQFFNDLFNMIYDFWKISPKSLGSFFDGFNIATETLIRIASETGYLGLPDVVSKMPESKNDNWTEGIDNIPSTINKDNLLPISKVNHEEIVRKFQLEINKGLKNISLSDEQSDHTVNQRINDLTHESIEEVSTEQEKPWGKITEGKNLQKIVRFIHEGLAPYQIAYKLGYETSTVYKRSSELRKKYGKETVPYFQEWRNIED